MTVFLIILSCVLFAGAIWALATRIVLAPALSYIGLVCLSLATRNGYPLLPVNGTILAGWFCMTLVVTFTIFLEPQAVMRQTRGMWYIIVGALAGLAVGLLGFTVSASTTLLYSIMILAVAAGIFLGFLFYTRTPDGRPVAPGSGNFFKYLLAKGLPTAITVMQIGVVLVLVIALNSVPNV